MCLWPFCRQYEIERERGWEWSKPYEDFVLPVRDMSGSGEGLCPDLLVPLSAAAQSEHDNAT
jgi:hypothetical protein